MQTKIKFVFLDRFANRKTKILTLQVPDFQPIMNGTILISSIEDQIINYLDNNDKIEIMEKYDMQIIIDYYVHRSKKRVSEKESFAQFLAMLNTNGVIDDKLLYDIRAYASISKTLFGRRKSHHTKLKEIFDGISIAQKIAINYYEKIIERIQGVSKDRGRVEISPYGHLSS